MKRMDGLDAVRGLAALMVACGHSFIALKVDGQDLLWTHPEPAGWQAQLVSWLMYAFDGDVAVATFFVLSGIVLGLSLDGKRTGAREYLAFIVRRVRRIYPAHLLVLGCICALLAAGFVNGDVPGATTWFKWWYAAPPTFTDVWKTATLASATLNPVTWTLRVEMIVALAFPVMHFLSRRGALVAFGALLILLALPEAIPHAWKFYVGLLIPVYAQRGLAWFSELRIPSPLVHFGRVSYSFYLWHFPILWFGYWKIHHSRVQPLLMQHPLPVTIGMCILSVTTAYLLAVPTYRFVELRGMGMRRGMRATAWPAGTREQA